MVSKKLKLILVLLGLLQTASYAQSTDDNWVFDSSKASSMSQYSQFQNYETPYPSKPNSMWELGFSGGHGLIIGDRTAFDFKHKDEANRDMYNGGVAGGITIRKAMSHVFSWRGGYWGSYISVPGYRNYQRYVKNETHMLSLELVASLNTLSSYRGNPKTNWYMFGGYSAAATTLIDGNSSDGIFKGSHVLDVDPRSPLNSQSNLVFTFGTGPDTRTPYGDRKEWGVYHAVSAGGGMAFKLSNKVNLGLEERFTVPLGGLDNLDGYVGGNANDFFAYSLLKLNINIGNAATHVEPLWWVNPNNYLYNEVATPKHMKIPPPVLPDADGDGVTDQFDLEPNTPAGCPVDSHGVTRDTDGDGVPDCKDKEVLTPQTCFPVDADGVGNCPCPNDSCFAGRMMMTGDCSITSLPSVTFNSGSANLSSTVKSVLDGVAQQLNASPGCNVRVIGYGASDKRSQQLSWDHVNAVIKYLSEQQGVSESRFIFTHGMEGSSNTVDLQPTAETGPNTVPAPFPQYKKSK